MLGLVWRLFRSWLEVGVLSKSHIRSWLEVEVLSRSHIGFENLLFD